jgi:hypothetical protein
VVDADRSQLAQVVEQRTRACLWVEYVQLIPAADPCCPRE